jgi:hypothetical protein
MITSIESLSELVEARLYSRTRSRWARLRAQVGDWLIRNRRRIRHRYLGSGECPNLEQMTRRGARRGNREGDDSLRVHFRTSLRAFPCIRVRSNSQPPHSCRRVRENRERFLEVV